jgi:anhydro-N-acetylmuramic acid kinase
VPRSSTRQFAVGLVSTIAGDAVEAAIIQSDGRDEVRSIGCVRAECDEGLRWSLLEATQNDLPTTKVLRLERDLTLHFQRAIDLLREQHPAEVAAATVIGMDGHTLRHCPTEGLSLQIGNPALLAELVGLPVVSGFRRHDMALGGQGTPLEAMYHWALLAEAPRPAMMVNYGAVTSITWLSRANEIIAGAVGPGMEILDEWVQAVAEAPHDYNGAISSTGWIDAECVRYAMGSPFFARPLPRAASRTDFERIDVSGLSPRDGAATICGVIAAAVLEAIERLPERPPVAWVTGVGSGHPLLLRSLVGAVERVRSVRERGLNPLALDAECFAWLAIRRLRGLPVSTPETTGCRTARCGGVITPPPAI